MIVSPGTDADLRGEAGYTLVELLVALAILALVSVTLLSSLRFGLKGWVSGSEHSDDLEELLTAQNFLRRIVSDAYPMFLIDNRGGGHVTFDGKQDSLRILAPAPTALSPGGRSWFTIYLDRDAHHLTAEIIPELADKATVKPVRRALLSQVRSVEFKFFGTSRNDKPAWRKDWLDRPTLPQLVGIDLTFAQTDRRIWPELIVAPQISADVGCIIDPITNRCRGR